MKDALHPTDDEISEYYFQSDADKRFDVVVAGFFGLDEADRLQEVGGFKSKIEEKYGIKIPEVPWVQFRLDIIYYIRKHFPLNRFPELIQKVEEEYNIHLPDMDQFQSIDDVLEYLCQEKLT